MEKCFREKLKDILHDLYYADHYKAEDNAHKDIIELIKSIVPEKKKYTHTADEHYFRKVGFNKCRAELLKTIDSPKAP